MVELKDLKPGDKVKIVDMPPEGSAFTICENPKSTKMGLYLGKVVTVTQVQPRCILIKQDKGKFAWTPCLIERKVSTI